MKRIVLGLVVLVVLGFGAFIFFFGQIAASAVESAATEALGVPVNVGTILLEPIRGRLHLTGLEISNPPGFDNRYFLVMGDGDIDVDMGSLFSSGPIRVERIELSQIDVTLERARNGTNYGIILNHLSNLEETDPAESGETGAVIDELLVRDVRAVVRASPIGGKLGEIEVQIPEIRLTDIGKDSQHGAELGQVAATVTQAILMAVAEKGSSLPGGVGSDLARSLGKVRVGESLSGAKKLLDGIGGLLKHDDN